MKIAQSGDPVFDALVQAEAELARIADALSEHAGVTLASVCSCRHPWVLHCGGRTDCYATGCLCEGY